MIKKHDMNRITSSNLWLLLVSLSFPMLSAAEAATDLTDGVDTSSWVCEYCEFEQGLSGEIDIGLGNVSDSSFKFGEYNGLYDEGAFLIGNATARYRGEDAKYYNLKVHDLGLDTREIDLEGGRQGSYRIFLNYDEIPHYISDSARTPYLGTGSEALVLPSGWVTDGTTTGMTELNSSLREVDLYTQRKRLTVGADVILSGKWQTAFDVRHEERNGQKRSAGTFFINSAQLVEPVDYVTDEMDFSVSYNTRKSQSSLAYYGSFFTDNNTSLTWQNAYDPVVAGADAGQRALPPDNQFHQFLFSSAYQLSVATRISGDIALGRMLQDENLLAATINPNLAVSLPRTSADAQVDTLNANLKLDSMVSDKLRLNAALRFNDRDNKTSSTSFSWVTTDGFIAAPRSNLPYSFTDQSIKLGADYRFSSATLLSGGYDYEKKHRTYQEVDDTAEDTFWGKLNVLAGDSVDVTLRAAHAIRDASGYHPVAETVPAENPLMRKYNMADRVRDSASIQAGFNPTELINIGLSVEQSIDDYTDSLIGLTGSRETSYNIDGSMIMTEDTTLHGFIARELIKSEQAGSQSFSTPDWFATNDDTIDSLGIGVKHQMIADKLDLGADYVVTRSTGKISVNTGAPAPGFPDLKTSLDSLKLYADYRMKENMTLHVAYWYEHYSSEDWSLDGVNPDTISNVVSFGEVSPDYNVNVVMVSLGYLF
jgi:MtrB/PioB family decaheme-associated outer membrane protein